MWSEIYLEKIKEKIAEFSPSYDVVGCDNLKDDLGFDSLGLTFLIVGLEDEFKIRFDDSDLDPAKLITVDDLVGLVARYL